MKKTADKNYLTIISGILCLVIFIVILFNKNGFLKTENNPQNTENFVRIIDVGQGDSILIYSKGYSALIDTGMPDAANEICLALSEHGIEFLDVLMISHLDNDHIGGVSGLLEVYNVKNLILPEISIESDGVNVAQLAINKVTSSGGEIFTATSGMNFKIGDFEVTVLAQLTNMSNENNRSVVAMAEIENKKFLFTGDIEAKAERALLKEGLNLKCDVLKVAHHGSNSSSTDEFIKAVNPRYAAISVGKDNRYGHPHSNVLSTLEYYGAEVLRTDLDRDIFFYINGGKISVKTK